MKNRENNKWNLYKNNKKDINYYNFDDIIDNLLKENKDKNKDNLYSLNYYKNIAAKFYSSSNNVNVKKNRSIKKQRLKNLFSEFRYSKDETEVDYVDEAVSTITYSTLQKI